MSTDVWRIQNETIAPGEQRLVRLAIAKLPTGTVIDLPVYVFRGAEPGPTLLLQGGLHGDEVGGVEILRRLLRAGTFDGVRRGAVLVVPILNVFGFIHFSRDVPDGKDINRSFPGSRRGSLASRVAWHYMQHVFPLADVALDFHTGGARRHNHPQVRWTPGFARSRQLAEVFAAPFMMPSKLIPRSFRHAAFKRDVPVVVYEAGESLRFDDAALSVGVAGAQRVLAALGIVDAPGPAPVAPTVALGDGAWQRASRAGLFHATVNAGDAVTKGQTLGRVADAFSDDDAVIKASRDGWVVTLNHLPIVNQGDALIRVMSVEKPG